MRENDEYMDLSDSTGDDATEDIFDRHSQWAGQSHGLIKVPLAGRSTTQSERLAPVGKQSAVKPHLERHDRYRLNAVGRPCTDPLDLGGKGADKALTDYDGHCRPEWAATLCNGRAHERGNDALGAVLTILPTYSCRTSWQQPSAVNV